MKARWARMFLRRMATQPATSSAAAVPLRHALTAGRKRRSTPPAPPRRMSSSHAMKASATVETTAVNVKKARSGAVEGSRSEALRTDMPRVIVPRPARGDHHSGSQTMRRHQQAARCHGVMGARMAS